MPEQKPRKLEEFHVTRLENKAKNCRMKVYTDKKTAKIIECNIAIFYDPKLPYRGANMHACYGELAKMVRESWNSGFEYIEPLIPMRSKEMGKMFDLIVAAKKRTGKGYDTKNWEYTLDDVIQAYVVYISGDFETGKMWQLVPENCELPFQ